MERYRKASVKIQTLVVWLQGLGLLAIVFNSLSRRAD